MKQCTHLDQIRVTETEVRVCPECVKMGDDWVHPANVPDLWPRRLLRFVEEQARNQAFQEHTSPAGPFHRARRELVPPCYADEIMAGELEGGAGA